jgi:predicted LPLAT superfamily acyltransferase
MERDAKQTHWSKHKEEAAGYGPIKLMLLIFRFFPVMVMRLIAFPVGFFYFICSKRAREESARYLERVGSALQRDGRPFRPCRLVHILSFALALVEKVESWGGKVSFKRVRFQEDDSGDLIDRLERGEGALLISSHLGNMELLRALAGLNRTGVSREIPVTAIVDFSVTAHFNRMLRELNPQSLTHLISANNIGPETVILLQDRLAAGELAAIAGDRTSAHTGQKGFQLPFLLGEAPFPYGPFFLAALLNVPIYSIFGLRRRELSLLPQYTIHIRRSPVSFDCSRQERGGRIEALARWFVSQLEGYCKEHPYQWYNFYDFWAQPALPLGKSGPGPPKNIPQGIDESDKS